MFKHCKSLYISRLFGVLAVCAMLGISTAYADICFLPSMECADPDAGTSPDVNPEPDRSCVGYNLSAEKTGGGWNCDECGGKYRCQCSVYGYELVGSNCIKVAGSCADSLYTQSNSKDSPWSCTECDDQNSRNYGKYKCECNDIMHNGQCVEDPCESSEYDYSASEANRMKEKGYTCNKCNYSYSDNYGEYDCYCDSSKEENDEGECVEPKNCHNKGMYDDRAECDAANESSNKKCTVDGDCYKIVCDSDKGYYDTEEACLKSQQTSWLELFERALAQLNPISVAYADPVSNLCRVDSENKCVDCSVQNCSRQSWYQDYPCCSNNNLCTGMMMDVADEITGQSSCVHCLEDNPTYRAPGCENYPCCRKIDDLEPKCMDNCDTSTLIPLSCISQNGTWKANGKTSKCGNACYECDTSDSDDNDNNDNLGETNLCEKKDGCWVKKQVINDNKMYWCIYTNDFTGFKGSNGVKDIKLSGDGVVFGKETCIFGYYVPYGVLVDISYIDTTQEPYRHLGWVFAQTADADDDHEPGVGYCAGEYFTTDRFVATADVLGQNEKYMSAGDYVDLSPAISKAEDRDCSSGPGIKRAEICSVRLRFYHGKGEVNITASAAPSIQYVFGQYSTGNAIDISERRTFHDAWTIIVEQLNDFNNENYFIDGKYGSEKDCVWMTPEMCESIFSDDYYTNSSELYGRGCSYDPKSDSLCYGCCENWHARCVISFSKYESSPTTCRNEDGYMDLEEYFGKDEVSCQEFENVFRYY